MRVWYTCTKNTSTYVVIGNGSKTQQPYWTSKMFSFGRIIFGSRKEFPKMTKYESSPSPKNLRQEPRPLRVLELWKTLVHAETSVVVLTMREAGLFQGSPEIFHHRRLCGRAFLVVVSWHVLLQISLGSTAPTHWFLVDLAWFSPYVRIALWNAHV